ncbi:MAG: DUF3592 domain-containing protein [Acidobacteriota bacterium]|nr:DUF3592 domain-containing protein [Acidobacteriota bacterium]
MNIRISPFSLGRGLFFRPQKAVGCAIAAVLIVVIGVLAIGAALFFGYQRHQRLARLTGEAPAQVLEVNVTGSKRRRSSRNYSTRITYRFQVDGRSIETEWTKSDDVSDEYEVGRRAKVCYDPANPDDNEIFPLSYRCGQ